MDLVPGLGATEGEITVSRSPSYTLLPSLKSWWLVCDVSNPSSSVWPSSVLASLCLEDLDMVEIVEGA